MKILLLQVTRFGDILCTLPVISALRRSDPEAEIHLLVRKRFAGAAQECPHVDHLWRLDTAKIMSPFIEGSGSVAEALVPLTELARELRAQKFDRVINLSYSPSSSYLTHMIAGETTPVLGFTRTADLYLKIPDKASLYFRAQGGLDKSNRIHVTEILGWTAGVEVLRRDWERRPAANTARSGVVCHLGASHEGKRWPLPSWVSLIGKILEIGKQVTLIGAAEERALAENVRVQTSPEVRNAAGETCFSELLDVMGSAELFIGADSAPLHAASLGGCRSLNLSLGDVRFWETGPLSPGSRILVSREPSHLPSDKVFDQVREMLDGRNSRTGFIECIRESGPRYVVHPGATCPADYWELVEWLHFGGPKPAVGGEIVTALGQIIEVCGLASAQLDVFYGSPEKTEIVNILDRLDDLLEIFRSNIRPLAPLLDEFRAEKENIPPGPREEIFFLTGNCYAKLKKKAEDLLEKRSERVADGNAF